LQRENRKLAAIVAADVAGYSRLIGQDEEGTLRTFRAHRAELIDPLIDEHGGRIANTAGDSLLLEFPSAVDAVRCAIAFQEGMANRNDGVDADVQICFRIGINVGDVIAEGDDLLGDGVNIAARLEGLCEPGGILLSDDAYRQVRNRIQSGFVKTVQKNSRTLPSRLRFGDGRLVKQPPN
jgi:class 3 adenylate cyclase